MILFAMRVKRRSFVRVGDRPPTLQYVIALESHPSIHRSSICCSSVLFHQREMSHLTLTWILNTKGGRKLCSTYTGSMVGTGLQLLPQLHSSIIKGRSEM